MDFQLSSFRRFLAITHSPYFFLLIVSFCILSYFFLDRPLALWVHFEVTHTTPHNLLFVLAQNITQLGKSTIYLIVLALCILCFKFIWKNRSALRISIFLLATIIIPSLVCNLFKFILGRTRPTLLFSDQLYSFTFFQFHAAHMSFPSGHSTMITGLMLGLCFVYNRYWIMFMSAALIIATSRIFVTAHFLSDVVAGMYLSILIVPWVYKRWFSCAITTQFHIPLA